MSIHATAHEVTLQVPHFIQGEQRASTFASTLLAAATARPRREYRKILSGVTFAAREGDRIALMGRNGAGKTTLLRVLSGAFKPTSGHVEVHGSVQALLNLGLGFHQDATVRENIFVRAAAMGMGAGPVASQLDAILDFSGLGHAVNHRLSTLSSGQRMRLGFAISTSVQHDIMLMDEWFGAGDAEFVEKARDRMVDRVSGSGIVILASHSFQMLRRICNLGMVLDAGEMVYFGPITDAIDEYKKIYQATPEYIARRKFEAENERLVTQQIAARATPDASGDDDAG